VPESPVVRDNTGASQAGIEVLAESEGKRKSQGGGGDDDRPRDVRTEACGGPHLAARDHPAPVLERDPVERRPARPTL
jgi:hypothetical protein